MKQKEDVIVVRTLSNDAAKKEIMKYFQMHPKAYPSDVAIELRLDPTSVRDLCWELQKEGKLEPAINVMSNITLERFKSILGNLDLIDQTIREVAHQYGMDSTIEAAHNLVKELRCRITLSMPTFENISDVLDNPSRYFGVEKGE